MIEYCGVAQYRAFVYLKEGDTVWCLIYPKKLDVRISFVIGFLAGLVYHLNFSIDYSLESDFLEI